MGVELSQLAEEKIEIGTGTGFTPLESATAATWLVWYDFDFTFGDADYFMWSHSQFQIKISGSDSPYGIVFTLLTGDEGGLYEWQTTDDLPSGTRRLWAFVWDGTEQTFVAYRNGVAMTPTNEVGTIPTVLGSASFAPAYFAADDAGSEDTAAGCYCGAGLFANNPLGSSFQTEAYNGGTPVDFNTLSAGTFTHNYTFDGSLADTGDGGGGPYDGTLIPAAAFTACECGGGGGGATAPYDTAFFIDIERRA